MKSQPMELLTNSMQWTLKQSKKMGFSLKKIGKKLGSSFKSVGKKLISKTSGLTNKLLNNKFSQKVLGKIPVYGKALKIAGAGSKLLDSEINRKVKKKATTVSKSMRKAKSSNPAVDNVQMTQAQNSIYNDVEDIVTNQTMLDKLKNFYQNNKTLCWVLGGVIVAAIVGIVWWIKKRR